MRLSSLGKAPKQCSRIVAPWPEHAASRQSELLLRSLCLLQLLDGSKTLQHQLELLGRHACRCAWCKSIGSRG